MARWVLTDHANALCQLVEGVENFLSELVEELVQIAEERPVGLPVIVLVVDVQDERVGDLASKLLHDRVVGRVLSRELMCERSRVRAGA
jgi:hypothetical protein